MSSLLLLPIDDPNPFDRRYSSQELASLKSDITDKIAAGRRTSSESDSGWRAKRDSQSASDQQ